MVERSVHVSESVVSVLQCKHVQLTRLQPSGESLYQMQCGVVYFLDVSFSTSGVKMCDDYLAS